MPAFFFTSLFRSLPACGALLGLLGWAAAVRADESSPSASRHLLVVVGAGGAEEYNREFQEQVAHWQEAAAQADTPLTLIGTDADAAAEDRDLLKQALTTPAALEMWLVLIGHGSYDGRDAKFNLRGPDVTDRELAAWLRPHEGEWIVINTTAASGSFLSGLSAPGRIVITATRNESEIYYTRFGRYFSRAIAGWTEADLDRDGQVSLLEAFLHSSHMVAQFYQNEGRIITEHALLDDNGDGLGTRAEQLRADQDTPAPGDEAQPDGELAREKILVPSEAEKQLSEEDRRYRNDLERKIRELKKKRETLEESDYYQQLEALLVPLAQWYEKRQPARSDEPAPVPAGTSSTHEDPQPR